MLSPRSETLAEPVKSSVFVNRLPHCDCSRFTTSRSSPCASRWAPVGERKWTCESPLYQPWAFMFVQSLQTQLQLALAGLDRDLRPQRLVLEAARHVHDDLSSRQPPLASAVDVGEGRLPQTEIAAHVVVPRSQVGVDLVVVPVRLVRHAVGRAEVDAAGYGPPGLVIDDRDVHPVLAGVDKLDLDLLGLDGTAVDDFAPRGLADLCVALLHGHRRRRRGRNFHIGGAGRFVVVLSPRIRGGDKLVG